MAKRSASFSARKTMSRMDNGELMAVRIPGRQHTIDKLVLCIPADNWAGKSLPISAPDLAPPGPIHSLSTFGLDLGGAPHVHDRYVHGMHIKGSNGTDTHRLIARRTTSRMRRRRSYGHAAAAGILHFAARAGGRNGSCRPSPLHSHCIFNDASDFSARVGADGRQSNCPDLSRKGSRTDRTEDRIDSNPRITKRKSAICPICPICRFTAEFAPRLGPIGNAPPRDVGLGIMCNALLCLGLADGSDRGGPRTQCRSISTRVAPRFPLC
jgi:hypothetical protein